MVFLLYKAESDLGPSQSTVSRVLNGTIAALTTPNIVRQFIDFPTDLQTLRQKQEAFMRIAGFPGVVGAIDGTHVRIISPTVNEEAYVSTVSMFKLCLMLLTRSWILCQNGQGQHMILGFFLRVASLSYLNKIMFARMSSGG